MNASFANFSRFGFSMVSGLPGAPVGRVRYQYERSIRSAGRFALPVTAAAAFVAVPATDDTALPAVEATLFVTVPTAPTVLLTALPTAPVTLVTLATPEVSEAVLLGVVLPWVVLPGVVLLGVVLPEVFPLVLTEPVAAAPVDPLTDDGQEAAPSETPELVE